ncbi:unnamed protein product [Urochloa humidicola]
MEKKKAYAVAVVIQVILAFNRGLSTFVYVFYRLAAAPLFLTPLGCPHWDLEMDRYRTTSVHASRHKGQASCSGTSPRAGKRVVAAISSGVQAHGRRGRSASPTFRPFVRA